MDVIPEERPDVCRDFVVVRRPVVVPHTEPVGVNQVDVTVQLVEDDLVELAVLGDLCDIFEGNAYAR